MTFFVQQKIHGKAAPRRSFAHGKVYNPHAALMNKFRREASNHFSDEKGRFRGAVNVELVCFFQGVRARMGTHHTNKPDCDNVSKFVCDSLSGVAFQDDKQVVNLNVRKFWTPSSDCMKVTVMYLK